MNKSFFLANLNWDKIREFGADPAIWDNLLAFWTDPAIGIQAAIIFGLLLAVLLLTRITKPLFRNLAENSDKEEEWKGKVWAHLERMLAPMYLILGCILSLVIAEPLELTSEGLIRPFTSAASAWAIYRLIAGFTKSRAWLRLIAVFAFSLAALHSFGLLRTTLDVLELFSFKVGDRTISFLGLLNGVAILLFLLWVSSLLGSSGEKKIRKLPHLPPSLQVLLIKILRVLLFFLSFVVALSTIGLDLSSFALLGGAIGVGIGFGLQKVVSNLVSGLILLLDRSIKPGDVIEIDGTYGWINSLRARYASVITRDGKEHLIPNEDLITNRVVNWSFSDRNVRVRVPLGISYGNDPRLAIDLCLEAALSVSRILQDPEPRCLLVGFGDNSVDLELRFWIDDPSNGVGNIRSAVLLAIWDKFKDNGIEIPFPQRDLHIKELPQKIRTVSEQTDKSQ